MHVIPEKFKKKEENVCVLVLYICPDLAITKIKLTTTSEATAMARIANMQTWPDIATASQNCQASAWKD